MFDILKNLKNLKVILIIVAVILALCVISFVLTWWKPILFVISAYVIYTVIKSTLK